jgi:hypothetical protein
VGQLYFFLLSLSYNLKQFDMKVQFSTAILILSVMVFLGSCTVEKRLYRPGLNIEWKGFKHHTNTLESATDELTEETKTVTQQSSLISDEKITNVSASPAVDAFESESFQATNAKPLHLTNNSKKSEQFKQSSRIAKVIAQDISVKSTLKMNAQLEKRISSQNSDNEIDILYSIGGLILLAAIVTLLIIGLFIGFALIIKIALTLLFLLLIGFLIYVLGSALF